MSNPFQGYPGSDPRQLSVNDIGSNDPNITGAWQTNDSYTSPIGNSRVTPVDTGSINWSYKKKINASLGIAIFLVIAFIAAVVLYWTLGDHYNEEKVKNVIKNSGDTNATFKNLTVRDDTTLGNSTSDSLTVNARVASDITPSQDSSYDLGSTTNHWDKVYTDSVVFEDGTSMIATDGLGIQTTGGFGYQRKVETKSLDGNETLPKSESGYLYVLEQGTSGSIFTLPASSGDGTFYDFVAGTSISGPTNDSFTLRTASGDYFTGSINLVSENTGPGSSLVATIMTPDSTTANDIVIDDTYPINISTGYSGIIQGSNWRVVDYGGVGWTVTGTMILESGPSVGSFFTPIR